MKYLATLFSIYIMMLIASPSVSVIKMNFAQKSKSCCQKNPCKKETPSGCNKDKCVLNLNFSTSQFIVSKVQYEFVRNSFEIEKERIISFEKQIISNYSYPIWQPPEIVV